MKSYFGLTIHYLNENNEIDKGVIGVFPMNERSTANYIIECLDNILIEFGLNEKETSAVVTDEGANISKAVDDYFGPEKHLPCAVHVVSHLVPDVLAELPVIDNLIKKIKNIVAAIKRSTVATQKLAKLHKDDGETPVTVIQDVETRFTAKKDLVERYLKIEKYLYAATSECKKPPEMLTRTELQIINDIYPVMKYVCEVINDLSGDKHPTCSLIIPSISCMIGLTSETKPESEAGKEFKKKFIEKARVKLHKFEKNTLCTVSTLLDPRFKRTHHNDIGCVAQGVQFINNLLRDPRIKNAEIKNAEMKKTKNQSMVNSNSIWSYHAKLKNEAESHYSSKSTTNLELKQFLDQAKINREDSAVEYWKSINLTFPLLQKVGLKYTSLIGSSIPSERVFSLARLIKTGEHLNRLVFLGSIKVQFWNLDE